MSPTVGGVGSLGFFSLKLSNEEAFNGNLNGLVAFFTGDIVCAEVCLRRNELIGEGPEVERFGMQSVF